MPRGYDQEGLGEDVSLGKGGPRLVRSGQIVEHRNSTGALARVKAASGVDPDDVATVSQLGGGGASFGMFNPLVAPAAPDPNDIETWTVLPSGWASWTPGGVVGNVLPQTLSVDRGAMIIDVGAKSGGTPSMNGIYCPVPVASEWAAYTRLSLIAPRTASSVFIDCGFAVAEDLAAAPDTSWLEGANIFRTAANGSETGVYSAAYSSYQSGPIGNSGGTAARDFPGSFWLRIRKVTAASATDYGADYSTDGIRWQQLHIGNSFSVPSPGPAHLVIYARADPSSTTPSPDYRLVVGPTRFATGSGANDLTSLMPAGT